MITVLKLNRNSSLGVLTAFQVLPRGSVGELENSRHHCGTHRGGENSSAADRRKSGALTYESIFVGRTCLCIAAIHRIVLHCLRSDSHSTIVVHKTSGLWRPRYLFGSGKFHLKILGTFIFTRFYTMSLFRERLICSDVSTKFRPSRRGDDGDGGQLAGRYGYAPV